MTDKPGLTILIPAYNESEGVIKTTLALKKILNELEDDYSVEAIFIDDGSKDDTAALLLDAIAEDSRMKVISHPQNRGLGAALRTGFENATGDLFITTDFDQTYHFSTIPEIVSLSISSGADIVTASPYHPLGRVENVPRYRLIFSFGASLLYRILVTWKIHTWTALFRVYRRDVVNNVPFTQDGFLAGTELLIRALQKGYTAVEYPTTLHSRTFGQSSIRIAQVTLSHIRFQLRLLSEKLRLISPGDNAK